MRHFVFVFWFSCILGYILAVPIAAHDKDDNKDSLSCTVCNAMVDMSRQNSGSSFDDVMDGMYSYCRLYYSNYVSNCKYIVKTFLYPVYCQARLTNLSWQAICTRIQLCSDKSNKPGDSYPSPPSKSANSDEPSA